MHVSVRHGIQVIVAAWLALGSSGLFAHDIYSSWADAKLLGDRVEIVLTIARSCAQSFLPDSAQQPPITPENFAAVEPRLRQLAPQLFELTVNGKPLALKSAVVKISGDADVTYTLTYSRPATGTLRFFAVFLGYLVDGHTVTLAISDAAGADLGWSPLTLDQARFQVRLPAPSSPKP